MQRIEHAITAASNTAYDAGTWVINKTIRYVTVITQCIGAAFQWVRNYFFPPAAPAPAPAAEAEAEAEDGFYTPSSSRRGSIARGTIDESAGAPEEAEGENEELFHTPGGSRRGSFDGDAGGAAAQAAEAATATVAAAAAALAPPLDDLFNDAHRAAIEGILQAVAEIGVWNLRGPFDAIQTHVQALGANEPPHPFALFCYAFEGENRAQALRVKEVCNWRTVKAAAYAPLVAVTKNTITSPWQGAIVGLSQAFALAAWDGALLPYSEKFAVRMNLNPGDVTRMIHGSQWEALINAIFEAQQALADGAGAP